MFVIYVSLALRCTYHILVAQGDSFAPVFFSLGAEAGCGVVVSRFVSVACLNPYFSFLLAVVNSFTKRVQNATPAHGSKEYYIRYDVVVGTCRRVRGEHTRYALQLLPHFPEPQRGGIFFKFWRYLERGWIFLCGSLCLVIIQSPLPGVTFSPIKTPSRA